MCYTGHGLLYPQSQRLSGRGEVYTIVIVIIVIQQQWYPAPFASSPNMEATPKTPLPVSIRPRCDKKPLEGKTRPGPGQ